TDTFSYLFDASALVSADIATGTLLLPGLNSNKSQIAWGAGATAPNLYRAADNTLQIDQGKLILNVQGANAAALNTGEIASFQGPNGTNAIIKTVTFTNGGTAPNIRTYAARGTAASPSGVTSADALGGLSGFGYGATGFSTGGRAQVLFFTSENWSDSAQGA